MKPKQTFRRFKAKTRNRMASPLLRLRRIMTLNRRIAALTQQIEKLNSSRDRNLRIASGLEKGQVPDAFIRLSPRQRKEVARESRTDFTQESELVTRLTQEREFYQTELGRLKKTKKQ